MISNIGYISSNTAVLLAPTGDLKSQFSSFSVFSPLGFCLSEKLNF